MRTGESFNRVNLIASSRFRARLLAPLPHGDEATEDLLSKNHSSVILNITLTSDTGASSVQFLTAGDAEVAIWERLWERYGRTPEVLAYDLLLAPHHCSWHSLSWEGWSERRHEAEISATALSALSQMRTNGAIVASSDAIYDDDNDPPCFGAKAVYEQVARNAGGSFYCTGEYPSASRQQPLVFQVTPTGFSVATPQPQSLLRPAVTAGGLTFPDKPVVPNKSAGFA